MKCQSCGRTTSETYCSECLDKEGKLKSFEEVTENLTSYYVETQGFDRDVAKSVAIGVLSHQPAWEAKMERIKKGKDMRMKTFLIVTAVFTVVGAGLAYWLGTRTKADEITSNNFAKTTTSPLEQIQERKVGDEAIVYEFKAPGDQNIINFNNYVLTFDNLVGTANSPKTAIYNYDVANRIGFQFDPSSMDTKFLMDGRNDYLQLDKNYNNQVSPSGSVVSFDMNYEAHDAPSSWLYDPSRGELRKDISVYARGDNLIVWDSTKLDTKYEKYVWNTKNNLKSPTRDGDALVNLGKRYYVCSSGNTIIIHDLETAQVTRLDASPYLQNNVLATTVANDNYICISSLNNAVAGKNGTYVYDIKNKTFKKVFDQFFDNLSINQNVKRSETIVAFAAYSDKRIKFGYFRPWETKPKSVVFEENNLLSSKQWSPLLKVNKNSIIWDFNEETKFDPTPIGSCDLNPKAPYKDNKIHVYDTLSNKDFILETDNRGEVFMFGDYIAWTKWDGKVEDQYINVCFSLIPPLELVDRKQFDNEGKPPFSNIAVKKMDGFDIRELMAKGDQNLEFDSTPDNSTSCLIFQSWNKSLNEFEFWAFDMDSEKGVLLDPDDAGTLQFLSRYDQDLFWPSSDCTKVNKYDHITKRIVQVEQPVEFNKNNNQRYKTKLGKNGDELLVTDTKTGQTSTIWKGKGEIDYSSSMLGENNNIVTFRVIVGNKVSESFVYIIPLKQLIKTGDGLIYDNCSQRYYVWERFVNDDEYYTDKPARSNRSIHVLDIKTGQQLEIKPEQNNIYEFEHVSLYENLPIIGGKTPEETYILWPTANIVDGNIFEAVGYTSVADIGKSHKEFKSTGKPLDMLFGTIIDDWVISSEKATGKSMLVAKNLATGEERVLDDNTTRSWVIKVGNYFVWEPYRDHDHQFTNICYSKIK